MLVTSGASSCPLPTSAGGDDSVEHWVEPSSTAPIEKLIVLPVSHW